MLVLKMGPLQCKQAPLGPCSSGCSLLSLSFSLPKNYISEEEGGKLGEKEGKGLSDCPEMKFLARNDEPNSLLPLGCTRTDEAKHLALQGVVAVSTLCTRLITCSYYAYLLSILRDFLRCIVKTGWYVHIQHGLSQCDSTKKKKKRRIRPSVMPATYTQTILPVTQSVDPSFPFCKPPPLPPPQVNSNH